MSKLSAAAASLLALCSSQVSGATPWSVDAPMPAKLTSRVFLDQATVAAYKDKLEQVVGVWGILENGVVTVTADRPTSFGNTATATVKVALSESKPVYKSVVSNAQGFNVTFPMVGLTLSNNQRGAVTVTDVAQFLVEARPTSADWGANAADPGAGKPRLVFISAAVLSVVDTSVLKKTGGGLTALLSGINLGGAGTFEEESAATNQVVSLAVLEPACRRLNTCGTSAPSPNLAPLNQKFRFEFRENAKQLLQKK